MKQATARKLSSSDVSTRCADMVGQCVKCCVLCEGSVCRELQISRRPPT